MKQTENTQVLESSLLRGHFRNEPLALESSQYATMSRMVMLQTAYKLQIEILKSKKFKGNHHWMFKSNTLEQYGRYPNTNQDIHESETEFETPTEEQTFGTLRMLEG